ncbi:P-loop NTPase fold protein [Elizabethkingia ursingii]|uniref:KAP NTPase domain-containing protein n=1 Tax=Elizabethkingia ursingii TaxID=1756150 RepID=A0AAJ3NCK9_9FLAO|nr:P-loop NTPase fold protein [Elizabethkingia ursingii]AQX09680.1 hypothetical protein BBD34_13985 [Elizabethkingia ursingii]OPB75413.1 hypothetical protein BAY32_07740 [Elizabethkingia ursingii]
MENNSTDDNIYKFLTNQPLGEDLFENKSQDKIAQVLSEKIITQPDFKIIGIDGEWGSGKSNLVKLLEKKLENSHKFFIYDVWGHQEDEQRYAILSELTDFITKENIIKGSGNWNSKLKMLNSKQKHTTTTNIPHLSIGFILSLFLIIYIPTVNTFVKEKKLWLQIILVILPLILLLAIFIKFYFNSRHQGKKNDHYKLNKIGRLKRYSLEAAQQLFKVYHNQKVDETKIEVISEKEPTVKEFRNWMEEINNDLNKPIVIVFDNFDRLPKKHILSIWSSLHIFFAEKEYSNIKIIIPFDREHVQNAFKELNGKDKKFGDDYVNKTFDIVFRITLPIMSNWKRFFEEQWKKAFVNLDDEELRLVVQVYEFLNRRITPREIISFINEILTIKLLDNNFKERYIAIFVLKKDDILENPLKAVTDFRELLGGLFHIYSNDLEYPKQLTAIIYHLEVDNALELIYTQELKDAMLKNDVRKFNEICKSDFIDSIFYSTVSGIESFENATLTLASIDEYSKVSEQNIGQTWNLFNRRVLQLDNIISKLQVDNWQIVLIKKVSDNKYLKQLLETYFNLIDDTNIEQYVDLIDYLVNNLGKERVLNELIKQNISNKNFVKLIEYNGEEYKKYKLSTDYKSLDQYLANLSIDELLKLENTKFLPNEYDFKNYKELLKNSLNTYINQNNIQFANDTLIKLKEKFQRNGDLKNLLEDSKIYSLYQSNSSSELPIINELIAMRIAKGSIFSSSYASTFNTILNTDDSDRAEEIANTILNYINYGDLLLLSKHFKNNPFYKQIILKMFNKADLGKSANIIILIEKYLEIKDSLDIDDNILLVEFNKWEINQSKLNIYNLSDQFITDCLNNLELNITKDFLKVFNHEFKTFEKDHFKEVFDDEENIHFKYFNLIEINNLSQASLDIYETKLIEKLKSGDIVKEQWWNIFKIYDFNNSEISVVNTLKNILGEILTSKIVLKVETIKILLPYFIKYDLLKNNNDIFRLVIKNEFLSDSEFIELLISNAEYVKQIYRNTTSTDKDGFRNLINEKRDNNPEFESLAKALDIRKTKIKAEED